MMTDHNLVSFKVYFDSGISGTPFSEVRRFGIENDVASSYDYLADKLRAVFPVLKQGKFQIFWKDAESDEVRISSDADLLIALTEIEDPIKKLYVKMASCEFHENPTNPSQERIGASGDDVGWGSINTHSKVVCDGCDGSVVGFRYKCLQCPDYDLCATCENKGFHPEHYMLRMPTPAIVDAWINDGRRGKFGSKWQHISCPAADALHASVHRSKKHFKKHHHNKHYAKFAESITDAVSQVMSNIVDNIPQSENIKPQSSNVVNNNNSNNASDAMASASSATDPSPDNSTGAEKSSAGTAPGENVNDNIIEPLIQNLDSVLSGVLTAVNDSVVDYQRGNKKDASTTDNSQRGSGDSDAASNVGNINSYIKNFLSIAISELSKAQTYLDNNKTTEKAVGGDDKKVNSSDENSVSSNKVAASIYPTAPKDEDILTPEEMKRIIGFVDDDGIRVKPVMEEPRLHQKEAENGWTLLTEEKKEENPKNLGAIPKTNFSKSDNNKTDAKEPDAATDKKDEIEKPLGDAEKVHETLRRMMAMGFSNEGNWLYDIIASKNGDIAAVLDCLLPARH